MYRGLASGCEIISIFIKDATREATLERSSGLVAEYIVAIDVTRVRFPAAAYHKTNQRAASARTVAAFCCVFGPCNSFSSWLTML